MPATAAQTPILTLTLNPALDMSSAVDALIPDEKLRCTDPRLDPGGGGRQLAVAGGRLLGAGLRPVRRPLRADAVPGAGRWPSGVTRGPTTIGAPIHTPM